MNFTLENLEYDLMVLVRISCFVMTAPFFSYRSIPNRMKAAISVLLSIVVLFAVPAVPLRYMGILGFSLLIGKEALIGAVLGLMCSLCFYIVGLAGQIMDMEMGLSMANMYDPTSNIQVTVTGNIYNYYLMLMLVVTNMHYYIIRAITDSFRYFNVGEAIVRTDVLKNLIVDFMANYFLIAVRIVLPVFCCMLMINVILGVLTKAAPQMNMFAVGIQIKVVVGIIILILLVQTLPTVSDFIFQEMKEVITNVVHSFSP